MSSRSLQDDSYLIIGGTTKAATTSLFTYLSDHPGICKATLKETRYFLDADYPVPVKRKTGQDRSEYNSFFINAGHSLRLEATPDYLHSSGTPERIHRTLGQVRFVFLLRDPIDRLVSWYRFASQNGTLGPDVSFEDYVAVQVGGRTGDVKSQHLLAMEQGRYTRALERYLDLYGPDRIWIGFFEDLSGNPLVVLQDICRFAGIDTTFFNDYTFEVHNQTRDIRFNDLNKHIRSLRASIRQRLPTKGGRMHMFLKAVNRRLDPLVNKLLGQKNKEVLISDHLLRQLQDYYAEDIRSLKVLLDKESLPWPNFNT